MSEQLNAPADQSHDCEEVLDLLYLFVIGELDSDETSMVVSHLAKCKSCQAALVQHATLNKAMTKSMPFISHTVKMIQA